MIKKIKVNGAEVKWDNPEITWDLAVEKSKLNINNKNWNVVIKVFDKNMILIKVVRDIKTPFDLREFVISKEIYIISIRVADHPSVS